MTAPTNALRSGVGLRRVTPDETFTAVFRIDVADRDPGAKPAAQSACFSIFASA
jgi:hypothetical protein